MMTQRINEQESTGKLPPSSLFALMTRRPHLNEILQFVYKIEGSCLPVIAEVTVNAEDSAIEYYLSDLVGAPSQGVCAWYREVEEDGGALLPVLGPSDCVAVRGLMVMGYDPDFACELVMDNLAYAVPHSAIPYHEDFPNNMAEELFVPFCDLYVGSLMVDAEPWALYCDSYYPLLRTNEYPELGRFRIRLHRNGKLQDGPASAGVRRMYKRWETRRVAPAVIRQASPL